MTFQIEDDVPVPKPWAGKKSKYPVAQMTVGQSFLIPISEKKTEQQLSNIRSHVTKAAIRAGVKITVRSVEGGMRIWRTE